MFNSFFVCELNIRENILEATKLWATQVINLLYKNILYSTSHFSAIESKPILDNKLFSHCILFVTSP